MHIGINLTCLQQDELKTDILERETFLLGKKAVNMNEVMLQISLKKMKVILIFLFNNMS